MSHFEEGQKVLFWNGHSMGVPPLDEAYVDTVDVDGDTTKMRLRLPNEATTFIVSRGMVHTIPAAQ